MVEASKATAGLDAGTLSFVCGTGLHGVALHLCVCFLWVQARPTRLVSSWAECQYRWRLTLQSQAWLVAVTVRVCVVALPCWKDAAGEVIKGLASIPAPGKVLVERIDPVCAWP